MDPRADRPYARTAAGLAGTPFSKIAFVEETASTNADAAALLGSRRDLGTSIVAEHQTRGSGRKGRQWASQPGTSLLVTTILPRSVRAAGLWAVPFWVALAVQRALRVHGVESALHWPNDLLLDRIGKIAGILCVSRVTRDAAWVACGVGVNVHRPAAALDVDPPPAFCDDVAPVDRAALLLELLRAYDATIDALADPPHVARQWERSAGFPGVPYRILKDGEAQPFECTAIGLAEGGGLVVRRPGTGPETIALADARALR